MEQSTLKATMNSPSSKVFKDRLNKPMTSVLRKEFFPVFRETLNKVISQGRLDPDNYGCC